MLSGKLQHRTQKKRADINNTNPPLPSTDGVFEIFVFNFNLRATFLISSAKCTIPERHVKKYLPVYQIILIQTQLELEITSLHLLIGLWETIIRYQTEE